MTRTSNNRDWLAKNHQIFVAVSLETGPGNWAAKEPMAADIRVKMDPLKEPLFLGGVLKHRLHFGWFGGSRTKKSLAVGIHGWKSILCIFGCSPEVQGFTDFRETNDLWWHPFLAENRMKSHLSVGNHRLIITGSFRSWCAGDHVDLQWDCQQPLESHAGFHPCSFGKGGGDWGTLRWRAVWFYRYWQIHTHQPPPL